MTIDNHTTKHRHTLALPAGAAIEYLCFAHNTNVLVILCVVSSFLSCVNLAPCTHMHWALVANLLCLVSWHSSSFAVFHYELLVHKLDIGC